MPGMNTGLHADNPTIVAAFNHDLLRGGLIVAAILVLVALAWITLHLEEPYRTGGGRHTRAGRHDGTMPAVREAPARRLLRFGFGTLWLLDGLLQAQPKMPLGMATGVIEPAAAGSPAWVQHVANFAGTTWSYHPIAAPASAVWIQIGLGLWLLLTGDGGLSRLGGLASVVWALVVWTVAEAFGGIFAPELTWMFGAPGAALFYALAGVLIAAPQRWWTSARLGRAVLWLIGVFFLGMAILQAWPGRGFWRAHGGALASMVREMAQTPQPHFLAAWLKAFAGFDSAHGFAVNLFVVIVLALLGAAFLSGRARTIRWAVIAGSALCLADWVLVEDLGFFGGVGTDPNSMIPMALVFIAGYVAISRVPAAVADAAAREPGIASSVRARAVAWVHAQASTRAQLRRLPAAVGACGVMLVGAVPMAFASLSQNADPLIAQATDGKPERVNFPAPGFRLIDQHGRAVSLAGLRGKTLALTFLDPVCNVECPIIGQELRIADHMLGAGARHVDMVAIDANPLYTTPSYLRAFIAQERLGKMHNLLYLTGSPAQLQRVWDSFGVEVAHSPGGAMVEHSLIAYVIDAQGNIRSTINTDPGAGTEASKSSFASYLSEEIDRILALS